MPIYEFYCRDCHTIYNFFSRTIDTETVPACPKCRTERMSRQVSVFAVTGRASEKTDEELPVDEQKLEKAMAMLGSEAEHINEDDPRQAANLMRKLTDMTGLELGPGMSEALRRMERGEDPDQIEAEMGDLMEGEDPFILKEAGARLGKALEARPERDETLYDLQATPKIT
jgi:putative FmdB family regulatory protein